MEGERPKADVGGTLVSFVGMVFWVGALCALVALPVWAFFAVRDLLAWNLPAVGHDLLAVLGLAVYVWVASLLKG